MTVLCASSRCAIPRRHVEDCADDDCRGCLRAQAADGLRLCPRDTERIGTDAIEAAQLYDELALRLLGGTGSGEPVSGTSDTTRLPNPAAVEMRAEIRHVLVSWCRMIAEERGWTLPADEVDAMAGYVARNAQWLAATDYADEVSDELHDLRRRARGVCYPRGVREIPVKLGNDPIACLVEGCPGVVTARVDTKACDADRQEFEFPAALVCSADPEHKVPTTQWHAFARAVKARAA